MKANEMIELICQEFEVTAEEVKGQKRTRPLPQIRAIIYANLYYHYPELSLTRIGDMFNRNHATVIHGIKMANNPYDTLMIRMRERVSNVVSPQVKLKWSVTEDLDTIPLEV